MSLHDINQAAIWADRIALLAEGRLLAVGPPGDVLTPELLGVAYRCPVTVERHPVSGMPMVLPHRRTPRDGGRQRCRDLRENVRGTGEVAP